MSRPAPLRQRSAGWHRRRRRKFERRSERRKLRLYTRANRHGWLKLQKAKHKEGVKELTRLFDVRPSFSIQHGRAKPFRLKPGVPPLRDPYHQARHRGRKLARASRKRNRGE